MLEASACVTQYSYAKKLGIGHVKNKILKQLKSDSKMPEHSERLS